VLDVYVDADGCPVREEVYRVAARYDLRVLVVSNSWMRVPDRGRVELVLVDDAFDAADDWIASRAGAGDVVVTADIPLAARILERGARALGIRGRESTGETIGEDLATREFAAHLRESGVVTGGPRPLERRDRSSFLQALDRIVQEIRRGR
jgi:uncharacterized protein YaiI (UPF0178 family)